MDAIRRTSKDIYHCYRVTLPFYVMRNCVALLCIRYYICRSGFTVIGDFRPPLCCAFTDINVPGYRTFDESTSSFAAASVADFDAGLFQTSATDWRRTEFSALTAVRYLMYFRFCG